MCLSDGTRGRDTVELRQLEVHQDHVGSDLGANSHRLGATRCFARELEVRRGAKKSGHPSPHHEMVVDDHHPNAVCQLTAVLFACASPQVTRVRVPRPGSLSMLNRPPMDSTRSRMMPSPRCPGGMDNGSKPRPSSVMVSSTPSGSLTRRTSTCCASACLTMLESAS